MGSETPQANRRAKDPALSDFYNDMNQHAGAVYKKVRPAFVVELDTMPNGWALTVWRAVEHPTREGYRPPDGKDGNRYAWDAKGRAFFDNRDDARTAYARLGGKADVREFCEANPYEGPRGSYDERTGEVDG